MEPPRQAARLLGGPGEHIVIACAEYPWVSQVIDHAEQLLGPEHDLRLCYRLAIANADGISDIVNDETADGLGHVAYPVECKAQLRRIQQACPELAVFHLVRSAKATED